MDGAGLWAAAEGAGARRRRAGLGRGLSGAIGASGPPQETAATAGRLQAAGDHHRLARRRQDQPDGALHGRHFLRGLQVHRRYERGREERERERGEGEIDGRRQIA